MRRRPLLGGALASVLAAPAIAQPSRASTLRFIPQANLGVLDPIWTDATVTQNHAYYVFDSLYGAASTLQPMPQMAAGHRVSDDGRVWRITLRDDLWFHDGSPVRGIDCAASLARWAKRDSFGVMLDRVVESWGAADDRTVEIKLRRPFPMLLAAISKPDGVPFIMPERLARTEGSAAVREMVGSGPFRFKTSEYNSGHRIVYERFERYVPRPEPLDLTSGGKVAHFQRVEWHVIPDPTTAAAALMNNEADWWERPLADYVPVMRRNPAITVQFSDSTGRLAFARLNHLHPPFDDVRLRRAVLMGVRQEDTMRAIFGDDLSLWKTCYSLFPRGTPYYREGAAGSMGGDLDAARAMVKAAGYAGAKAVVLAPTDFPDINAMTQVSAAMLKSIGLVVDLQETDWGSVVQRRTSREPVEKGGWSMFHTTGSPRKYATPADSPLVRGLGVRGYPGFWSSPRAEELTEGWLDEPDPTRQARLAAELNQLALDEVATIPLGQFYLQTAFRRSITGIAPGQPPFPWGVRSA